jgi:uncharacterized repeat protein (TIGR03803 family)
MRHRKTLLWVLFAGLCCQAQTYTTLYAFKGGHDGYGPIGPLTLDSEGNLYGATLYGGRKDDGTVFKLSQGVKTTLHSFTIHDGPRPNGGLILDAAGNLYGTSSAKIGIVFKLSPQGAITTLLRFNGLNGGEPESGVISDAAGNLYGTTVTGGANGQGTVYELTLQKDGTYKHKIIWQLDGIAASPYGTLAFDSAGNLYGTTAGIVHGGAIFKLTPGANGKWVRTLLYEFGSDGWDPTAGVVVDSSGNLYGTTQQGGDNENDGIVYEYSQQGQFSALHTFTHSDGNRASALVMDAAGNLYGETQSGGAYGWGTLFKLDPSTGSYTDLHDFDFANLAPIGGLIMDGAGNLYGVASGNNGTVFEIQP